MEIAGEEKNTTLGPCSVCEFLLCKSARSHPLLVVKVLA